MTAIPNNSTKISILDVKNELEMPFLEQNQKEFTEKKASLLAFLTQKLQLTKAKEVDYENMELNAYQKVKSYLNSKYDLKFDIVGNNVYCSLKGKNEFSILNEFALQNELYEYGLTRFNDKLDAVLQSEIVEKSDVFVNYFFNLPDWTPDKPDYIGQLCSYIKTTDDDLFKVHLKKHLIRSIACSLTRIDFNKHCLVFFGKQNDGKSYLVRFLCPKSLPIKENLDMQSKDSLFSLAKYFLINLDEMQGLQKQDVNKIKDFISKSKITARVIYQKKDSDFWRRANFYGTTNEEDILTDTTGNVRFLIFEILDILHDNGGEKGYDKNIDINNVYAQAFYYMVMGEKSDYELSRAELAVMDSINKRFLTPTPEMDLILKYFSPTSSNGEEMEYMTNSEIATFLQKETSIRIGTKRLAQALKFHKFERLVKGSLYKYALVKNG